MAELHYSTTRKVERSKWKDVFIENNMVNTSMVLKIIGILLIIGSLALIAIDLSGMGDTSGLDYKDVGILVVGVIILILGFVVKPKSSIPPPSSSTQAAPSN
ncbi:MAG: hypothetical protein JRN68_04620 [Nitrososphaerota archaeon]|jgi:hypothetical protein|nr:hypothetical protein [Nitrososphaerota archaeon]